MMLASNIILIEGEAAHEFLEAAQHPDPEMIRKRDAMFAEWDALFGSYEDDDLVIDTKEETQDMPLLVTYVPVRMGAYGCVRVSDKETCDYQTEWNLPIAA